MVEIVLTAKPPLAGLDISFERCHLRAVPNVTLVSAAIPLGGEADFGAALKAAFDLDLPSATMSTVSGDARALRTSPDQIMLLLNDTADKRFPEVANAFGHRAYTTDQTDAWVICELSGPGAVHALARLCPIDLDDTVFPIGAFARTVMEHMGAYILRTAPKAYTLLSARSSAQSFAHALEQSAKFTASTENEG